MRREQLGELVNLTSAAAAQRRTAEMPAVELVDLLRKDRELEAPAAGTPDQFEAVARPDYDVSPDTLYLRRLAAGTVRISRGSQLPLMLGCLGAFFGGFALTIPLWW